MDPLQKIEAMVKNNAAPPSSTFLVPVLVAVGIILLIVAAWFFGSSGKEVVEPGIERSTGMLDQIKNIDNQIPPANP